jgi:hypothetical protein
MLMAPMLLAKAGASSQHLGDTRNKPLSPDALQG